MVLALGIEHTARALNAQSAVDEMTNEMFRRNAETLKQGAMDAALASERGIVDVETLPGGSLRQLQQGAHRSRQPAGLHRHQQGLTAPSRCRAAQRKTR